MGNFVEGIERIREVANTLPDDDPDKLDLLNVEGDYSNLMEWAIKKRTEALAMADSCKELQKIYKERQTRFENSADRMKDIIKFIMDAAQERKYTGVAGTASIRAVAAKPIVQDENLVPDEYKKTTISIDKTAINAAYKDGKEVAGCTLDNGGETITIRVK